MSPRRRRGSGQRVTWADVPSDLQKFDPDLWDDRDAWLAARELWGRDHGVSVVRLALDRIRADVWRLHGVGLPPEEDQ